MKLTGRRVRRLAGCGSCGEQWGGHLSWSPDGSRIAFSRDSGPHGAQSLWVFDTVSRSLRRLTDCRPAWCADIDPAWAPRAKLILFSRIDRQVFPLHGASRRRRVDPDYQLCRCGEGSAMVARRARDRLRRP